jgi:hypothetical protein
MCPLSHSNGHDAPGLIDELVPGIAAVPDDIVIGLEDAVGEPVISDELSDVLHHVQLRAFWRQWQQRDVRGHVQHGGEMPPGLIEQHHRVFAGRDQAGYLRQVQVHRRGVAEGQDQSGSLAVFGTDSAEDIVGGGALILGCCRAGPAQSPAPGDLVLLADPGLVGEPDLYGVRGNRFLLGNALQLGGEVFLNAAMAPSAWA